MKAPHQTHTRLAPVREHPLYWALSCIVGLTDADIRKHSKLSYSSLERMRAGHELTAEVRLRLCRLLATTRDKIAEITPPREKSPGVINAYRTAWFAVVNAILEQYQVTPDINLIGVGYTPLQLQLLNFLWDQPNNHELRSSAIFHFRKVYTRNQVATAAKRAGVRTSVDENGEVWWHPPLGWEPARPFDQPVAFELPPEPELIPPRSERIRRLHDLIVIHIGKAGGHALGRDIVKIMESKGYSRQTVFRAMRGLKVIRASYGFGKNKRTIWSLPDAPPLDPVKDMTPTTTTNFKEKHA